MSEVELKQAQDKVRRSHEDFEHAIDQLKEKVEQSAHQVETLRDSAGDFIENYLNEKMETVQLQLKTAVSSTLDDVQGNVESFVNSLQEAGKTLIRTLDEKPVAIGITIFLGGFLLGVNTHRRSGPRQPGRTWMSEECEGDEAASEIG